MRPRLKPLGRRDDDREVVLFRDVGVEFKLGDKARDIRKLLDLLDGTRTPAELASSLGLSIDEISDALGALDDYRLLEDADARDTTASNNDRYVSNLAFFSAFATLDQSSYEFQHNLSSRSVLVVGAGGFGSWILPSLAGLGVGRLVVVDSDTVALKNLNRQLLYRESDIGASKLQVAVEHLRAVNSSIRVDGVDRRINSVEDLTELLDGIDLVVCAADEPPAVHLWVNAACVDKGIPFVAGGWLWTQGAFYSVLPGVSPCRACWPKMGEPRDGERVNRATAPTAGLTASHMTLEVLRILTGFAPPIAAGSVWIVDSVTGDTRCTVTFERNPICTICGDSRAARLRPLTVVRDGEDFVVGAPDIDTFITVPEVGVVALRALQNGGSLQDAEARASEWAGEDVNVAEFVETLGECGFFLADGEELRSEATPRSGLAAILFSRIAWYAYGLLFFTCINALIARPELLPSYKAVFFLQTPALSVAVLLGLSLSVAALHEAAHWFAARREGVRVKFSLSRRMFLPVFETDLTGLWALPRERRYSPMLAGMALNTVLLSAAIAIQLASEMGVAIPSIGVGLAGVLIVVNVIMLAFQFLFFLRTDLYAVGAAALGCRDLYRVSMMRLRDLLIGSPAERVAELEQAHPRDLAVSRWLAGCYLGGIALMLYVFFAYLVPSVVLVTAWMIVALVRSPFGSSTFRQALPLAAVYGLEILAPALLFVYERAKRAPDGSLSPDISA